MTCDCFDGEEFAEAIECLCVEKGGTCDRGEDCRCKNQDVAEDGEW